MTQRDSQIDVTEINFEPKYLSFCEKQKFSSETFDSPTNRLAQLKRMYQNVVKNSKHVISKLCFMLSKFIPFDSAIKQSFNFIQQLQKEWKYFNNQHDDRSSIINKSQVNQMREVKKQEKVFIIKTKEKQQSQILPVVKLHNVIKSQVSTLKTYPLLMQVKQKTDQTGSKESSLFQVDQEKHPKSFHTPEYKMKLRDQFYHIRQFIIFWLYPRLDVQQDNILQKKMILNCYIAWNNKVMRQIQITETSKIQMELTVQIKLKVPQAESKFRIFKGIGFKKQYINQMNLTDCKSFIRQHREELSFEQVRNLNPLDQIIMIARRLQKNDEITPYNEQKMHALDEALGLI